MKADDWCGRVVRTRSSIPFGEVVGAFAGGPYAGRLRVHGSYRFGGGTRAQWEGTLVYATPRGAVAVTRRGSLKLRVEAMEARAAWLVSPLPEGS